MYEPITKERLERYVDRCQQLADCIEKKERIIKEMGSVSGIDYSKTRVMNGSCSNISQQERYAIKLHLVNKEIDECKAFTIPEHKIITTQIARLKNYKFRKIITLKYIEGWMSEEIIEDFFMGDVLWNPDNNMKLFKQTQEYSNFKRTYMFWQKSALEELEEISSKPYISVNKQLTLGD